MIALVGLAFPTVSSAATWQIVGWGSPGAVTTSTPTGSAAWRTVVMPATTSGQPQPSGAGTGSTSAPQPVSSGSGSGSGAGGWSYVQFPSSGGAGSSSPAGSSPSSAGWSGGSSPQGSGGSSTPLSSPGISQSQTVLVPSSFGQGAVAPPPDQAQLAQEFLALVNAARAQHNEGPLTDNPLLDQLALAKAQDLVVFNYFSHYSPRLGWPIDQEKAAGFSASYMGAENMAVAGSIQTAFDHLMASPTHQENLLDPAFTQTGIAVVVVPGANSVLVEELFAGPSN